VLSPPLRRGEGAQRFLAQSLAEFDELRRVLFFCHEFREFSRILFYYVFSMLVVRFAHGVLARSLAEFKELRRV
jgi:hypothetical protein